MQRIRVVQIGTAHDHAGDTMETLRALDDCYDVLGICEPDGEARRVAERRSSFAGIPWLELDEALRLSPDAVVIETEEKRLVETAQIFAEAGVSVHMDKPGGEDYGAFEHLVNTLKAQNLPFHMGYMYRYNKAVQYCRDLVQSGALGEIFSVEAHMSCWHNAKKRAWLSQFPGGMMFFLGCHLIDLVYMLCGMPKAVHPFNASTHLDGVDSQDYALALLEYERGYSFVRACAAEVEGFSRRQLVVLGSRGTVVIEPLEERTGGANFGQLAPTRVSIQGEKTRTVAFAEFGRYMDMMRDFAEIVAGEHENPYDYAYELAVQKLILQACGIKEETPGKRA